VAREEEAVELIGEIEALGRKAAFVKADITRVEECRRLAKEAFAAFGRLDVVVNNAGFSTHQPFETIEEEDFDLMLGLLLRVLSF
jgi:NAD(P)-dependent dehydrogenase (short-subunit alcohol dehydrogenase family)